MKKIIIGTRESQLAVWQATLVQKLLLEKGFESELLYIKSDGDIDLVTPLYEIGVQGIFTRTLDAALLAGKIDIAVHSMKDVPVQLAKGTVQAAVLSRGSYKDILVFKEGYESARMAGPCAIATSSIRRKAQWLHRYPNDSIENLRGNVNTRIQKVTESNWNGAVFAGAGLERINLRPQNSIDLDWMLPAPAQGAIMVVCREGEEDTLTAVSLLNDAATALCTKLERYFLKELMGGCATPISALAEIKGDTVIFRGNILSPDGKQKIETERTASLDVSSSLGADAAKEMLMQGAREILNAAGNEEE